MRTSNSVSTWQQARQWWVAQPPGTLGTWQTAAARFLASATARQVADRIEHLVSSAAQPVFELVVPGSVEDGCKPSTALPIQQSAAEPTHNSPPPKEAGPVEWKAPSKKGAYAHACQGVIPLCKQKRQEDTASFKRGLISFRDIQHARSVRKLCPRCTLLAAPTE